MTTPLDSTQNSTFTASFVSGLGFHASAVAVAGTAAAVMSLGNAILSTTPPGPHTPVVAGVTGAATAVTAVMRFV